MNPQENNPQSIEKTDENMLTIWIIQTLNFQYLWSNTIKTENQNNVNIYAFGYEEKQAFPIYESKEKFEYEVNLSLMTDGENKHYVLIKDFNMFMYHKTKHRQRKHFCMYCLQRFSSEEILSRHKTDCIVINEKQAIKMPEKGNNTLKFNNFYKQLPVPFLIHVDFEAITEKIYICVPDN